MANEPTSSANCSPVGQPHAKERDHVLSPQLGKRPPAFPLNDREGRSLDRVRDTDGGARGPDDPPTQHEDEEPRQQNVGHLRRHGREHGRASITMRIAHLAKSHIEQRERRADARECASS